MCACVSQSMHDLLRLYWVYGQCIRGRIGIPQLRSKNIFWKVKKKQSSCRCLCFERRLVFVVHRFLALQPAQWAETAYNKRDDMRTLHKKTEYEKGANPIITINETGKTATEHHGTSASAHINRFQSIRVGNENEHETNSINNSRHTFNSFKSNSNGSHSHFLF